jgi:hypothetical protein
MEMTLAATAGSGTNPIAGGTFGVCAVIHPHAFNSYSVAGVPASNIQLCA